MQFFYFVVCLLLAMGDAYPTWSEEMDAENNSYEDNQSGKDDDTDNYSGSAENNDSYYNHNNDNRRDSPYSFSSYSGQSEFRRDYDSFRPETNNGFADDDRLYSQPHEYNNHDEGFHGRKDYNMEMENSNENELENQITDHETENYYSRDEGYPEDYNPSSRGGYDYRALKRRINLIPKPKPRTTFPSTDHFNRNTYERTSDRGNPVTYGDLGRGNHNKNIYNFYNKIVYTG